MTFLFYLQKYVFLIKKNQRKQCQEKRASFM